MNKKQIVITALFVIVFGMFLTACTEEKEPETIAPTGIGINAQKVLVAGAKENLEVPLTIEPKDAYPADIALTTSDEKVATATIGAIDDNGNVITAAEQQKKKDELAKTDKEASEEITVPTNSAIITGVGYGECEITATLDKFSDNCKVTVADKQVALTFDDGACPETLTLLKGLKKEDVSTTFFIVGEMTERSDHIEALKQAIKDGHEIGNHTYNHNAGATTLKKELAKADKVIVKAGGEKSKLMRPPGGAINRKTMKCGKSIIMWSVDTMDWRDRDAGVVSRRIVKESRDGDIVLLHDLHKTSVKGALKAIPKLKKKGFYVTTVTDLLGAPKANTEYKKADKKTESRIIKK